MNPVKLTETHSRKTRFAEFRFYEELNDFLPASQRKTSFRWPFSNTPAIRDVIQAIGVPHTEIDLVLVDGESVDFAHRLKGGERIAVYPVFERLDISPVLRLRPEPLRVTRFIVDVHLGKLARYLRMLGFDTAYDRHVEDTTFIQRSLLEKRIILTRSLEILKLSCVTHGYWLRHREPRQQIVEILQALDLYSQVQPFTRCMNCNGQVEMVAKPDIEDLVAPRIFERFSEFNLCRDCGKVYWRGSHYQHMLQLVRNLVLQPTGPDDNPLS